MKKLLLFVSAALMATNIMQGQIVSTKDSLLATFEHGLDGATCWGAGVIDTVANPAKDAVNSSDTCLHFTAAGWEGVALHFSSSQFRKYFSKVQLKVYMASAATLTFQLDGGTASAITLTKAITAGAWQNVTFDISNAVDQGYTQFWMRTGATSDFYIDSAIFVTVTTRPENGGFELPQDGIKYQQINLIPGWFSNDNTTNNSGREYGSKNAHAYMNNSSGNICTVLDTISSDSIKYKVSFISWISWTPGPSDTVYATAFISAFGADRMTRTIIDSINFVMRNSIGGTHNFSGIFSIPAGSPYAGDSLALELGVRLPAYNNNTWVNLDSVRVQRGNYFAPDWTTLPIAKVVFGTVSGPTDFTGAVKMRWDADSLYLQYDITDDSIVNSGTAYQVDNIEVYIDMNNSKQIHWPRNGGWIASDPTFDTVDYQLRLVPNVPFATNNTARPAGQSIAAGYNQVYERTANGYKFNLSILWNTLKNGFVPSYGTKIGYDNDVSDNDKVASDANRNQITFNSPTTQLFNDPSLWATLKLEDGGLFSSIPDVTKPSVPANVAADTSKGKVVVTWDASTDNIAVMKYLVFNGIDTAATVLAKKTGNKATLTLANGAYTLGVAAVDNYGNTSNKATVNITVNIPTGIRDIIVSNVNISPNPVSGILTINGQDVIKSVSITNYLGQTLLQTNVNNTSSVRLNVANLQSGIYLVRVQTLTGVAVKRIVKQ